MEIPILVRNSKVDYRKADIKDLIKNVYTHCSKLDELTKLEFVEDKQLVSSQTLYVIQDCIQILKYLEDSGYNIDIDFQVHNYKLRNYKRCGKIGLTWMENREL
ncbi:hypothetical protein [Clostridium arbusti]|uniref:hypothetical protein n=2 Tax=Clostridium TaxID=1485 RepID=UPI00028A28C5|nr:hypothetical protein [Clostridium arbusti]